MPSTIAKKTSKKLSAHSGLAIAERIYRKLKIDEIIDESMPSLKSGSAASRKKFRDLLMGLVSGAECLDDMGALSGDEGFTALCDEGVLSPKSYGDFLRSFSKIDLTELQNALIRLGFEIHCLLFPNDKHFIFDIDSTPNYQYGKVMEGVRKDRHGKECLDTLDVFDHKGIQYFLNVRPGATGTARGAEDVIHRLLSSFGEYSQRMGKKWRACIRADRGYYNVGFINACLAKGADLIIGVRQHEEIFPRIVGQIHNWRPTDVDNEDRIKM